MSPTLALLACLIGIAGLFFLSRDNSAPTSKWLWLAVLWLGITGSRPVSEWLGVSPATSDPNQLMEGSPFDRAVFELLLAIGIVVLIYRGRRILPFLKGSWPVLLYVFYCLLSVVWSDYPDVSFKRWIKSLGDLVMALIVATDPHPLAAIKRLCSRLGFVLLPLSVVLIKYFGDLGRGYDPSGAAMNTGVTTNKNTLGVITLVVSLGGLWNLISIYRDKEQPNRSRRLIAQLALVGFGVIVLLLAHSATSLGCFLLGSGLIFATNLPAIRRNPVGVHALTIGLFVVGGLSMLIDQGGGVVHSLGRESTLTGRTDIWKAVLPAVSNPILGAGFESFWLGPRLDKVWSGLSQYMHVNEAHNGYIEVYLNLGWIGILLIALMLIKGYKSIVAAFRTDPSTGGLLLAYLFATAFYGITEAAFRLMTPIWTFFLLALVAAGGMAAGAMAETQQIAVTPVDTTPKRIPKHPLDRKLARGTS
jgi:exopolysaccharide production protein ExoQ